MVNDGSVTGDWYPDERSRSDYWRGRAVAAEETARALRDVLEDAHDALGELLANPTVSFTGDWDALPAITGNACWAGLKERIDAALKKAGA